MEMDKYTRWMETNPKWLKIVLCFWILDWSWAFWRIAKALEHNNRVELILGILWILFGGTIGWTLDIVFILLYDYPFWFR